MIAGPGEEPRAGAARCRIMTAGPSETGAAHSSAIKGSEEELHPSLASDPAAGVSDEAPHRSGMPPFLGWTLLGLGVVLLFVLALVFLKPQGPAAPSVPDVIVQADKPVPKAPPADLETTP